MLIRNIWLSLLYGLLSFFLLSGVVRGQIDSSSLVMYTPDFKFDDGIYINFDQVKNNSPILKSRLITDVAYDDRDYFDKVLENRFIYFYDPYGIRQEIKTSEIWGFCRNGVIYIAMEDGYYRITVVGKICHFVATVTTYDTRYNDPYYYNPYYYNSYNRYGNYPSTYSTSEMRQYLLNFETGNLMDYDVGSLAVMLMSDPELHDEYSQLRKKKRRQLKFLYLRKFNERNPLYIPVHSNKI